MAILARQFVWPDAAGTPTDPGTTFAAVGPGVVYEIGQETDLALILSVSGGNMRAVQVLVEIGITAAGVETFYEFARRTIPGAPIGTYLTRVKVPTGGRIRVSARRFGGSVNSLLTIAAQTRYDLGLPNFDGQPLELAAEQVAGIECWSDGAGAHEHPAASPAYAASPAAPNLQIIPVGDADTLVIEYVVSALAATTIEFVVLESADDGTTFRPRPAISSVVAGVVDTDAAIESCTGAIPAAGVRAITREIDVTPGTQIVIAAQRVGGGAGTALIAWARLYRFRH
jgi:hypothetical protein